MSRPTRPSPAPPARRQRPARPAAPRPAGAPRRPTGGWLAGWRTRRRWLGVALLAAAVPVAAFGLAFAYCYFKYGPMIDARLGGEQQPMPRIFGRPFDIAAGEPLSVGELRQRLNDDGYAERPKVEAPGEFAASASSVVLMPRPTAAEKPRAVRVDFSRGGAVVTKLTAVGGGSVARVTLEAPLLSELATGGRRRYVPLAQIPRRMVQAVIDIEDKRFYEHPGVDPIRAVGAVLTNLRGTHPYLEGGSTLTQQIVKNTFLTSEKTLRRKVEEQLIALVVETRLTKSQILELYLNDTVFGQRGPFAITGVAEAARIFFGEDLANITLPEAATIAGVIQSPSRLSPFRNPDRARDRRNLVLHEMAAAGDITPAEEKAAASTPLVVAPRALENEAPYFVDYASQVVDELSKNLLKKSGAVDVYTTVDLHLQRLAQEAVASGMADVDRQLSRRKRGRAQAAMVVVDPHTGDILALVGGRSYDASQYDRAVLAQRQPGSVFKPFVYLAAFERMADEGGSDLTPATVMTDEPTTFMDGDKPYTPSNYENEYSGPITLRQALAHSRNIVAIKVAEATGYDRVAALWKRIGVGAEAKPYPAIALGVFEATPLDIAQAYTVFPDGGVEQPLRVLLRISDDGKPLRVPVAPPRTIARPNTSYLVTSMMQSVIDEGTGAGARAAGFTLDAAGKTGTTNDLRDAWFVGFTPDLLAVVWVGLDDNEPIGLSGTQAALPIWTTFMKRATAGHANHAFPVPDGVEFADVDHDNGKLATPFCPRVVHEAFLPGTEPHDYCDVHGGSPSLLSRLAHLFGKIIRS